MANTAVLVKRFEELETQLGAVEATKRYENSEYFAGDRVDSEKLLNWQVKARHLLTLACGADSVHLAAFLKGEEPRAYRSNYEMLKELKAIFLAAKEDFAGGFVASVRQLVQAEVFDTELDQARELLAGGYATAAAVITGVVLETAMRDMCSKAAIAPASLNKMNTDLTKAGVYNLLTQKRITAMADIRNNAAHGNPGQFQPQDVTDMIAYVESFLAQYL
ncbi:DUF4145 domain-containing protein [Agrobacterium cavarae]